MKKFNLRPSEPDILDYQYKGIFSDSETLPQSVDLSIKFSKVVNQGNFSSCSANALQGITSFMQGKGKSTFSRMFSYYGARTYDGTEFIKQDNGATLRNLLKFAQKIGMVLEKKWPYVSEYLFKEPERWAWVEAALHQINTYERVPAHLQTIKSVLADNNPLLVGMPIYVNSYAKAEQTGRLGAFKKSDTLIGGHAVVIVGYDDTHKAFKVRNSYGKEFANDGHFWMPYTFLPQIWEIWRINGLKA